MTKSAALLAFILAGDYPLRHNGATYEPGDIVEMTMAQATAKLEAGRLALVEEKEPETKEPETKEPETKEPETKEPETKEPETKEPETKEPETKEPETKEPEAKEPAIEDEIIFTIVGLKFEDEASWMKDGRPQVKAIEAVLGKQITAAQRDAAWAVVLEARKPD